MSSTGIGFGYSAPRQVDRQRERLSTLDGLRGIAALSVFQFHTFNLFGFQFASSYLAVDLFFVLSGIVLAHAYEERFRAGFSVKQFMIARVVRLYPLYLVGSLAGASFILANMMLGNSDVSLSHLVVALGLAALFAPTPNGFLGTSDLFPFVYPAWSLFFELMINLVYAAIFPVLTARLLILIVALGAVMMICAGFQFGGLNTGFNWGNFTGGFGRVTFSFFTGVLLARFPLPRRGGSVHAYLCVALLLAIFTFPVNPMFRLTFDLTAAFLVFPALTAVAAVSGVGRLTRQCFDLAGRTSYAVYALHATALWWAMGASSKLFGVQLTSWAPASGLCLMAAVCLLAYILDRYLDDPLRQIIMKSLRPEPKFG